MDNQDNSTPPADSGKDSLTPKLLITLAAVLVIGGLIWLLNSGDGDDDAPAPAAVSQLPDEGNQAAPESSEAMTEEETQQQTIDQIEAAVDDYVANADPDPAEGDGSQTETADQNDGEDENNDNQPAAPDLPAGRYVDYRGPSHLDSLADTDRWLNFHADWCPFCQALDEDINNNLDQIPDGVTIVKVDFDDNQDLRVRYGVTRQTVFVRIDAAGNEINRFDGYGRNATLSNINSAFGY